MDSNSDMQRPSRAKRLDYYAMNLGTDSGGDSDEGLPARSRRRLDESQRSEISDVIITPGGSESDIITLGESASDFTPGESASQVLANDAESSLSRSTVIRNTPMAPKSWVWKYFHTTQLETTYIHKASQKSRPDRLVMCTRCPWSTTDAVPN
ncbi:hypothetical protein V1507DRAFT_68733 [Lipomyces tetrasporus]